MKRLSFSIAINLITENFKKGANAVKNQLRSIQMQILTFAAALGAGGVGLMGLVSRMKDVARETSRALTALKNVSGGVGLFADNLRFLNKLAKDYGVEINTLVFNFAKFKAAGDSVGMSLLDQRKIFEATSRAAVAYGMSAEDTNLTFLAITQMMSKGKISSEELRRQLGERLPIAMAAMAKAAGVPINKLDDLLKKGKLLSGDILPKFADALNDMIPSVDTDNIETSLNRLSNTFNKFTEGAGVKEKYKAIIDGLTALIEIASRNIHNIILGVVAAIVFVVANGATRVWRSYQVVGANIIASAEATNAKMVAATAARVEAEIALDRAKSAAFFATEKQRLQAAQAVAKAEVTLRQRVAAETKAIELNRVASAQAAAIKTGGIWATTGAMIKGTFLKLGAALKSMWNSFAPALIISAIVAAIGYFKNMYDEAKRVKNILSDFKKESSNVGNTQEVKLLQAQLSIMNDKKRSQDEINKAQAELRKMLGLEKGDQRDLNALVAERIKLLKATAQADFYAQKNVEVEDQITKKAAEGGLTKDQALNLARIGTTPGITYQKFFQSIYKNVGNDISKAEKAYDALKTIIDEYYGVYNYTNQQLASAVGLANKHTTPTPVTTDDTKPDKTVDKRLEAFRKLDEADRQRQLDKIAFDNEMRQKAIDNMDEGFLKEFAQLKLNHDRELQEIEEYKKKMAKAQIDELKNQYVSKHGNTKGFEASLKTANLNEVLPEGLKPEDIANQVTALTDAANAALNKGLVILNKDLADFQDEERLRFASQLNQQLYDINRHYAERLKLAKGNADLTKQLTDNRNKETRAAVLQSIGRQLDYELQYNQKVKEILTDRYVFEADKRREALEQEIKDQKNIFNNLEKQVLNDPNNDELAKQLRAAFIELKRLNQELGKTKAEKLREIAQGASEIFSSLRDTLGDFGLKFSDDINKALDGVGKTLDGLASIDVTKPVSIITGGLQALGGLAQTVTGIFGGADYSEYNKLKEKYDNLLDIWDELISKKKEYLSTSTIDEVNRVEKESLDLINKQADAVKKLAEARLDSGSSMGSHSIWYRMWKGSYKFDGKNWRNVAGEISSALGGVKFEGMGDMLNMTAEQLQWIKENYSGLWSVMDGDFRGYLDQLIQYGDDAIEIIKRAKEQLTGVSFDNLKDSFLNTLADMDSDAKDFADDFSGYLQKAILKAMLDKTYAKRLEDWYDSFADANRDANIDSGEYNKLQNDWNNIVNDALADRDKLKDLFGWTSGGEFSQDSSKGYSINMDQDTGGAILGRITGLHETGLQMLSMISGLSLSSNNIFTQSVFIGNELKKQTEILDEIKQVQIKSFFITEEMNETIKEQGKTLDKINKNTKDL